MPVFQGGGEMIKEVSFAGTTFNDLPYKYEAGTPNYIRCNCLRGSTLFCKWMAREMVLRHDHGFMVYATAAWKQIPGLRIIVPQKIRPACFICD